MSELRQWDGTIWHTVTEPDTGSRNISTLLLNGWTGTADVRRSGPVVQLTAVLTAPAVWNAVAIAPLPGFMAVFALGVLAWDKPGDWTGLTVDPTPVCYPTALLAFGGSPLAGGLAVRVGMMWMTSDAWPATLPGTP